jgi:hypothetical protein
LAVEEGAFAAWQAAEDMQSHVIWDRWSDSWTRSQEEERRGNERKGMGMTGDASTTVQLELCSVTGLLFDSNNILISGLSD